MDYNLIYSGVKKRANQALKRLKGFLSSMTVTKDILPSTGELATKAASQ